MVFRYQPQAISSSKLSVDKIQIILQNSIKLFGYTFEKELIETIEYELQSNK